MHADRANRAAIPPPQKNLCQETFYSLLTPSEPAYAQADEATLLVRPCGWGAASTGRGFWLPRRPRF